MKGGAVLSVNGARLVADASGALFWPEQEPMVGTTTPDPDQLGPAGAPEIPDTPQQPAGQE